MSKLLAAPETTLWVPRAPVDKPLNVLHVRGTHKDEPIADEAYDTLHNLNRACPIKGLYEIDGDPFTQEGERFSTSNMAFLALGEVSYEALLANERAQDSYNRFLIVADQHGSRKRHGRDYVVTSDALVDAAIPRAISRLFMDIRDFVYIDEANPHTSQYFGRYMGYELRRNSKFKADMMHTIFGRIIQGGYLLDFDPDDICEYVMIGAATAQDAEELCLPDDHKPFTPLSPGQSKELADRHPEVKDALGRLGIAWEDAVLTSSGAGTEYTVDGKWWGELLVQVPPRRFTGELEEIERDILGTMRSVTVPEPGWL